MNLSRRRVCALMRGAAASPAARLRDAPRWMRRVAVTLVTSAVLALTWPAPTASAHAFLLSTEPAAGFSSSTAPSQIVLVFDEVVSAGAEPISVVDSSGHGARVTTLPPRAGGREVAARFLEIVPRGSYVVRWQVASADGDPVIGTFSFGVDTAAATVDAAQRNPGLALGVVGRWLLFVGVADGLGGIGARRLARSLARRAGLHEPAPWLGAGSALVLVGVIALAAHGAGDGHLLDGLRHLASSRLVHSEPGRVAVVQVLAATLAAALAALRRRSLAAVALVTVVVAEGWRSHLHSRGGTLGAFLTGTHLLAAAIWVGALVYVVRTGLAWRHDSAWARLLTRAYARGALLLVAVVVGTGVLEALLLVHPLHAWWTTAYGRVLLVKLTLVAGALVAAALGRHRVHRATGDDQPEPGAAARWELGTLGGILLAAAALISLPTPSPVTLALASAPAPVGPIEQLGTLAGRLNVGISASAGQVTARLSLPGTESDPAGPPVPASTYDLHGTASAPAGGPTRLRWRRCGNGCFTAAIRWQAGANLLELTPTAHGAPSGTTTFSVPCPRCPPMTSPAARSRGSGPRPNSH